MQKFVLSGNLTRDVDFQQTDNGTSISKMSVAVRRTFIKDKEQTSDFFNVVVFGKQAENCARFLKKGSKVLVVGVVQIDNYTDKDGNKKQSISVRASEIEFLSAVNTSEKKDDGLPTVEDLDDTVEGILPF